MLQYSKGPLGRAWVLLLAAAGTLAATAGPASAAVPGIVRVSAASATDSADFKSVTVTCPVGKQLIGTGYEVSGATGEVVVDDFRPNGGAAAAPTSVFVGAYEEDPLAASWTLTAYAICANPLPGLVRISVTGALNSTDFHSTTAACPAGKTLTGSGFEVNGATGEAVVDDFQPNGSALAAPTSVSVGAYEADPDYLPNWSLTAYAICANPLPGLVRASIADPATSDDFHSASTVCPAGKVLTGTGFQLTGATGEATVDDLRPSGSSVAAPTSQFTGAYEADPNLVPTWSFTGYGICAT
ncbi:MAG TPA: hypothetical protein VF755_13630 [Catenuloplanes sp.]|jgi:hypothetical protein